MDSAPPLFFGRPSGPLVLVLAGAPEPAGSFAEALRREGYEARVADGIAGVLPAIRERRPVAIVWDASLPGRPGWEGFLDLRRDPLLRDIPSVPFAEEGAGRAPLPGRDQVREVSKPVDPASLLAGLRGVGPGPGGPLPRVLVIDDEAEVRNALQMFLTRSGFRVDLADGGERGIRMALESPPDAILLDIRMPGADGFQVADRLRAYAATADVPILVLTASALTAEEQERLRGKVFSVSRKGGFTFEKLLSHLRWVESLQPVG